jgi:hypothetical protein
VRLPFRAITPTAQERSATMPGDDTVAPADVVMDRGFTVPGTCTEVWPWIAQLGKGRAGWYLPRRVERFLSPRARGLRHLDPRWQVLRVGEVIPDYGRDETFTVLEVDPPHVLVYNTTRRHLAVTWSITLTPTETTPATTRVRLRLRLAGVRRTWLVETGGELIDMITVAGLAAGLKERLQEPLG